ncbi:MAG: aldehyde dehydrogenase family protein, partial [Rickettsiales bacterium]
ANDTPYGLASYVQSGDLERARKVARRLRAGMVHLNGAAQASGSPFGGYKQSGNGREGGEHGLLEFLELKAVCASPQPPGARRTGSSSRVHRFNLFWVFRCC